MNGTSSLLIVAVFSNLSLGSGCSFAFVDGPPPKSARRPLPLDCTTNPGWPVVDTLLAGWFMLNLGVNASKEAYQFKNGADEQASAVAFGLLLSLLTTASAATGYSRVSGCKDALAEEDGTWSPPPRRSRVIRPVAPTTAPSAFPEAPFGSPGLEGPPAAVGAPPEPEAPKGPRPPAPIDAGAPPPAPPPVAPPVRQMRDNE